MVRVAGQLTRYNKGLRSKGHVLLQYLLQDVLRVDMLIPISFSW